jgi:hypothetical protein
MTKKNEQSKKAWLSCVGKLVEMVVVVVAAKVYVVGSLRSEESSSEWEEISSE